MPEYPIPAFSKKHPLAATSIANAWKSNFNVGLMDILFVMDSNIVSDLRASTLHLHFPPKTSLAKVLLGETKLSNAYRMF
jgi:hypothetical protein